MSRGGSSQTTPTVEECSNKAAIEMRFRRKSPSTTLNLNSPSDRVTGDQCREEEEERVYSSWL